jgi:hypothetical protein
MVPVGGTGRPVGGTALPVGGTGTAVVGGGGGDAGVAGGAIVGGAVPGAQGVVALTGVRVLFRATPAVGLDEFGAFTPDVVAGLFAVVFGLSAGVFVPGVFAVAAVAGAAGVVEPGAGATGTHGTGVGILGVVAGRAAVGAVVCANMPGVVTSAPVIASALIQSICLVRTSPSLEEADAPSPRFRFGASRVPRGPCSCMPCGDIREC